MAIFIKMISQGGIEFIWKMHKEPSKVLFYDLRKSSNYGLLAIWGVPKREVSFRFKLPKIGVIDTKDCPDWRKIAKIKPEYGDRAHEIVCNDRSEEFLDTAFQLGDLYVSLGCSYISEPPIGKNWKGNDGRIIKLIMEKRDSTGVTVLFNVNFDPYNYIGFSTETGDLISINDAFFQRNGAICYSHVCQRDDYFKNRTEEELSPYEKWINQMLKEGKSVFDSDNFPFFGDHKCGCGCGCGCSK